MINVLHSGRLGDVLYSVKAAQRISERHLGEKIRYYVREIQNKRAGEVDYYKECKDLLAIQPCVGDVQPFSNLTDALYSDLGIDYNLDNFRSINPWKHHVLIMHLKSMGLPEAGWQDPWLFVDSPKSPNNKPFVIVQRTFRYRNPLVNWADIHSRLVEKYDNEIYFVGLDNEFRNHLSNIQNTKIQFLTVENMLDLARYVQGSDGVVCNQSILLPMAQGLGKNHYLELERNHAVTVCIPQTTEHIMGGV